MSSLFLFWILHALYSLRVCTERIELRVNFTLSTLLRFQQNFQNLRLVFTFSDRWPFLGNN